MSITLDVNNFLQNEMSPGAALGFTAGSAGKNLADRKMEAMLHKELENIAELPKDDSENIFNEIENVLKSNKLVGRADSNGLEDLVEEFESYVFSPPPRALSPPQIPGAMTCFYLEYSPFTPLPDCVSGDEFLVTEEPDDLVLLEPELYSVQDEELLPVTTPSLASGIYRKVPNADEEPSSQNLTSQRPNVFMTATGGHGRIVSAQRFHELYVFADEDGLMPSQLHSMYALPFESLALDGEPDGDQPHPALGINRSIRVSKEWDALSMLAYNILKLSNRDHIVIDRRRNQIVRKNYATNQRTIYRFLSLAYFGLMKEPMHIVQVVKEMRKAQAKGTLRPCSKYGRPPKRRHENASAAEGVSNKKLPKVLKGQQKDESKLSTATTTPKPIESLKTEAEKPAVCNRFGRVVRTRNIINDKTGTKQSTAAAGATADLTSGAGEAPAANDKITAAAATGELTATATESIPATGEATTSVAKAEADDAVDDSEDFFEILLADLKDRDFRCRLPMPSPSALQQIQEEVPPAVTSDSNFTADKNSSPSKRRLPPGSTCPACNKIFLGRRMQRHFVQYPDHMQVQLTTTKPPLPSSPPSLPPSSLSSSQQQPNNESNSADLTLFNFLVSKLQRAALSEDQRVDLFLNEINDLVAQLQLRSSRLIRNTSGLHFVSARCSRVLGIPEGHYALDMNAIENEAPPAAPNEPAEPASAPGILNFDNLSYSALPATLTHARTLEYSALSMDETLTDEAAQKLNLSAGGKLLPPSEESLLRTVGDLVHDGLQKLQQQTAGTEGLLHAPATNNTLVSPSMHYDASDNAVEAVGMETDEVPQVTPLLGLSVDFFQFNQD